MSSNERDNLRAHLLSSQTLSRKRYPLTFFGRDIEIVQPTVSDIENLAQVDPETGTVRRTSLIDILINYAYVSGTDERIFEEGDRETLQQLPFGSDIQQITDLIDDLMGGSIQDKEKN